MVRARRFAGLYLNEDPQAPNYDAKLRIIRSPLNGSAGPYFGSAEQARPFVMALRWPLEHEQEINAAVSLLNGSASGVGGRTVMLEEVLVF